MVKRDRKGQRANKVSKVIQVPEAHRAIPVQRVIRARRDPKESKARRAILGRRV